LAFQSFNFECTWWRLLQKRTWWRLFQKHIVRTKFDISVFIIFHAFYSRCKYLVEIPWYSEWVTDCCLTPSKQFISCIMARTSYISLGCWCSLCNRLTRLVRASSLQQQSVGRHFAPLGPMILIPCLSFISVILQLCIHSGQQTKFS